MTLKSNKPKLSIFFTNPHFIKPFRGPLSKNFEVSWNSLPFTPPPNRWTPLLSMISFPFRSFYKKTKTFFSSRDADVIFVEFANETLAFVSKWRKNKKIVTRLHRYELFSLPKADWSAIDLVVVVNKWMAQNLEEAVPSLKGKIKCIHNFLDVDAWEQSPNKAKTNTLSIVGSIQKRKGHDKVIIAFSNLLKQQNNLTLNIIGTIHDKKFYDKLISLVKDLDIEKKINFKGYSSDLKKDFQKTDIILSFSEHESTHLTLFEGLSCGAWPLSRNWDGVEEFLPSSNIFSSDSDFVKKVLSFYSQTESENKIRTNTLAESVLPKFSNPDPREQLSDLLLETLRK